MVPVECLPVSIVFFLVAYCNFSVVAHLGNGGSLWQLWWHWQDGCVGTCDGAVIWEANRYTMCDWRYVF
jgi:hypothetical protein